MLRILTCLVVLWPIAGSIDAASFDTDVPPKAGEKYKSAAFRIWIPDGVKPVRAVIVRQHGCGRNGIDHSDDLQWRALAKKHGAALLGSNLVYKENCSDWFDPKNGSERAFLDALKTFATESKHPELEAAPWAIWGHSGGSIWACHMANKFPDRVVAVWGRSASITEFEKATFGIPIVFNYGVKESEKGSQFEKVHINSTKAFETYRPQGAIWSIAVDPKSSHDCRESRALAIPFFDAMLKERLTKDGAQLTALAHAAKRWRADPMTLTLRGPDSSIGDPLKCHWLPSETFAKLWAEYCQTGTVKDTTEPPTPSDVRAAAGDTGVTVTWIAECDLESGVKAFAILRDGKRIATVGSPKGKGNQQGHFQARDYGDEPVPRNPAMLHIDAEGKAGAKYEVIQINFQDLESKPSVAATAAK